MNIFLIITFAFAIISGYIGKENAELQYAKVGVIIYLITTTILCKYIVPKLIPYALSFLPTLIEIIEYFLIYSNLDHSDFIAFGNLIMLY